MKFLPLVVSLAVVAVPAVASAGASTTGNVPVTAAVAANCTLHTNDLSFGNYDPIVANVAVDLQSSTTIVVVCTKGTNPISP